jgi:hypothetical protein
VSHRNGQASASSTTFLGAALARLWPEAGFTAPIVLCNDDHRFLVGTSCSVVASRREQSRWMRMHRFFPYD